jgi:dTDP-4-dehydrorhamnose reductase
MKMLILGSTGMLGMALYRKAKRRKITVIGVARSGADRTIDVTNGTALQSVIFNENPDIVINTIAITNLDYCERNPSLAYLTNARPASIVANICSKSDTSFIHISTDHYYTGDKRKRHTEKSPITLVNEYARTKYAAEWFARTDEKSLIIRTNIVGFKNKPENPTFVEWCIKMLTERTPTTIYDDFYTSPIDVYRFSEILLDLIEKGTTGVLNVAGEEVSSKKEFILELANALNLDTSHTKTGSVQKLAGIKRAESLGLNVNKAEKILGYKMPDRHDVINNLVHQHNAGNQ